MSRKKTLIIVGGPTASGKTEFAIRLARHFDTHVLSCDSRQFFRELSIGTAKPTAEELSAAPHHFIGHLSIEQEYHAGAYEQDALALLDQLFRKKDTVILTGGSGLYLKALCEGLDVFPEVPPSIRNEVEELYRKHGLSGLQAAVAAADPAYFAEVDRQNPHRLIRALAVFRASGQPFSSFRQNQGAERPFTPIYLHMHWPRSVLYERINRRVVRMMEEGLLEETRRLLPYRRHTALQTVGYQELFAYLDGEYDLTTAVELIQRNTRRYAKRQLTWMRRDGFWKHFHPQEWEMTLDYLQLAMAQNWRWSEPEALPTFFPEEKENRNQTRILALRQKEHLLAAVRIRSSKRFELIEPPYFAPGLPPAVARYFLHEAISRTEEAAVYALLPSFCARWLFEWNFEQAAEPALADLKKSNLSGMETGHVWFWREAFSSGQVC